MARSKHGILLWLLLQIFAIRSIFAKELTIDIDLEKPVAVTDEKFLSLAIDPAALVRGAALSSDFERSIRLAHALTPAYVRLGGPRGTLYQSGSENPPDNDINRDHLISESEWALAYQWAEKAGLDVIACISAEKPARGQEQNSEEAEEIVSFSDQMGFNASWQLGYECQIRCNATAADLGKRLVNLRQTLNAFPRYTNSMIVGPDIVAYKTKKERQYLQDYFNNAGNALSAVTWHPEFDSITSYNDGVLVQPDDLEEDREDLYKVIGRFMENRPLWIAESKPEEYKSLYLGALITTRRLGNAARSKVDVIMRQPEDLTQPSPDYWVSLLHKTLVGRQVFDGTVDTDEENHVYIYYQCTKSSDRYQPGSITIFGINFNPEDVEIRLKNTRITTLHEYLLSPGFEATNRMFSESILLNNETLALLNDEVPEMKPIISSNPEGLGISLPSASIGFWVLPDFKVCRTFYNLNKQSEFLIMFYINIKYITFFDTFKVKSCQEPNLQSTGENQQIKTHVTRSIQDEELFERFQRKPKNGREHRRHSNRFQRPATTEAPDSDTEGLLQEYKNRISMLEKLASSDRTRSTVKRAIHEILEKSRPLISRVEHARSSGAAKEALRALGLLLTRVPFLALDVTSVPRTKRARRELFDEFLTDEEDVLKRGSRQGVKGRRSSQKMQEHFVDEIRPKIFAPTSESGENTFYGFFKTDPVEGFPQGDVFCDTGDYQNYGDGRKSEISRGRDPVQDYVNSRDLGDSWMDYGGDYGFYEPREYYTSEIRDGVNPGELWEAEDADYGGRRSDDALRHEDLRVQAGRNGLSRLTGYYEASLPRNFDGRDDKQGARIVGSQLSAVPREFANGRQKTLDYKPAEFLLDSDDRGVRRLKRKGMDLGQEMSILDQEMIKEDDANSKDCNCRVIRDSDSCTCREKRDVVNFDEAGDNVEIISEQDALASDAEAVPEEVEVFSELRDEPMAILQMEPSSWKMQRDAGSQDFIIQEDLSEPETVVSQVTQIGTSLDDQTESPDYPEVFQVDDTVTTDSSMVLSPEEDDNLESSKPVRREGQQFFLEEGRTEEEEKEVHNHGDHQGSAASHEEDFSSHTVEKATEAEEASGTDIIDATLDPVALYEEDITESPEKDHEENKVARGGSKRQADMETAANTEEGPENIKIGEPRGGRPIKTRLRNPISNQKRMMKVMERARTMLALKEAAEERKRRRMEESARVGSAAKLQAPQKLDQTEKLKNKLKEGRQKLLKQFQKKSPEEDDEEERKVERREVSQAIKGAEDLRDAMDRDQLKYMMMYEAKREGRSNEKVDDKEDLSVTEVEKPRKVRERVVRPRDRRLFRDSGILEHSNPREMQDRIISLENVLQKGVRGRRYGDGSRNRQSYYALVESLEDPRFFYYPDEVEEEKMSMQVIDHNHQYPQTLPYPYFVSSDDLYDLQRYRPQLDNLEILDDSNEEIAGSDEDSEELRGNREIYMIDPSTYRGGEPTLQLYRPPSKLRYPERSRLANYDLSWVPIQYRTQRVRQAAHQKREGKIENPDSSEAYDEEQGSGGLANVLVKALDLPSAGELFKILSEENGVKGKQNSMRSIRNKPTVEATLDEVDQNSESLEGEDEVDVSKEELLKKTDAEESHKDEQEDSSESVNIRNRRDTGDYFEDSSRLTRKQPREIKKSGRDNYVCLKENSQESSEDDSAGIFKIVKENEYYKAVPIRESSSRRRISPERVDFLDSSKLSQISEDHAEREEGHSNEENLDYENVSDQEYYGSEAEDSGERMDLQRMLLPDQSGLFMVLPWSRRLTRPRRETVDLEKENKEVQYLETSTTELPVDSGTDEVEAMIAKKVPPKKYSAAGSLFNYLTLKKNLRKGGKEDLPSLIEGSIPKVENVVVDSLRKAENLTGTVEQLFDDLETRFDETTSAEDLQVDDKSTGITGYAFHSAIRNAKKFFMMLAGIAHVLRG
ncbi:uncharacterized protein LOC143216182 [Lasioglossum baleicum]|uniref:uncharacterized protein LOC143216182 n=1 Tax=Lasioglossum baleicum TaxID=434251 RepID=UPI003FCCE706